MAAQKGSDDLDRRCCCSVMLAGRQAGRQAALDGCAPCVLHSLRGLFFFFCFGSFLELGEPPGRAVRPALDAFMGTHGALQLQRGLQRRTLIGPRGAFSDGKRGMMDASASVKPATHGPGKRLHRERLNAAPCSCSFLRAAHRTRAQLPTGCVQRDIGHWPWHRLVLHA